MEMMILYEETVGDIHLPLPTIICISHLSLYMPRSLHPVALIAYQPARYPQAASPRGDIYLVVIYSPTVVPGDPAGAQ
jgi:hypothetical protein